MVTRIASPTGITSRGPTAADAGFSLSSVARESIIVTGSTAQSTVDDRNITTHTLATIDHEANLQAMETVPGTFSPYLGFESLDPEIATVNERGIVTRVGNGTARILAKTRLLNRRVDVAVLREAGQSTITLDSYVAGSLARDCANAIDTRLAGVTPSTAKPIFNTANHDAALYVRNTGCWAADIDLTCVSPWNSAGGIMYGGTAISPRHIIFARHFLIPNGSTIRFVTSGNAVVSRTMTTKAVLSGEGYPFDLAIGLLDSDLPGTITPAKVLPADTLDYLPSLASAYPLPCLGIDQEEKALVTDLYSLGGSFASCQPPSNATRLNFYEPLIMHDSGNPCFLVIGGVAVLLTTWTFGGPGAGPRIHALHTEINAALTSLGGGYQLTSIDLSAFTDFS